MAKHINELIASRRAFLGGAIGLPLLGNLGACATTSVAPAAPLSFASVAATNADTITLPPGYRWRSLISWGDALFDGLAPFDPDTLTRADQERRFGQNNDMLALFAADYAFPPPKHQRRMILCANNEYVSPELTFPGVSSPDGFSAEQIEALYAAVGVSIVELEHGAEGWRAVRNAARNRRITPFTPVHFTGPAARHPWIVAAAETVNAAEPDRGDTPAGAVRCGTLGNCAGGLTPWGTYLTAEENFDSFFFGSNSALDQQRLQDGAFALDSMAFGYPSGASFARDRVPAQFRINGNVRGPALYGWVTEIDPYDPTSTPKKRTALGRKKNECATTALAPDNRIVVYMGDDQRGEFVYKFVTSGRFDLANRAANMDLLDHGQLYVAQFAEDGSGQWLPVLAASANAAAEAEESPVRFNDDADVLMRARDAARFLGATPMDRPEDIEAVRDENWRGSGAVLIVCTNNSERGFERPGNPRRESERPNSAQSNLAGHVIRIDEDGADNAALSFRWDVFAMGGDPDATTLTAPTRSGTAAHLSVKHNGAPTISGDRFACPDNLFIDSKHNVWIATDGNDSVFGDCNDCVLATHVDAPAPRPMKRFLVGPIGGEICGPLMAPDERAFFCAIQHPGGNDVAGTEYSYLRWSEGKPPTSNFPEGGSAWPRSTVIVITRDDGGEIGL